MRTRVPPINTTPVDPESFLRATLQVLERDFQVDIDPAKNLHGQELTTWIESTEKKLMEDLKNDQ